MPKLPDLIRLVRVIVGVLVLLLGVVLLLNGLGDVIEPGSVIGGVVLIVVGLILMIPGAAVEIVKAISSKK